MRREIVQYAPPRIYARVSRFGDLIILAGQDGNIDEEPISGGIEAQTERLFENTRQSLAAFGATFDDILRTTLHLVDNKYRDPFHAIQAKHVATPVPGTTVVVKDLYPGFLVEMDIIAGVPQQAETKPKSTHPKERGFPVKREIIQYDPPRVYARGSRFGNLIFLAGQAGDENEEPVAGGIEAQAERLFRNMKESLEAFGASFDDILRTTVYMTENDLRKPFFEIRKKYITTPVPSSTYIVKDLYPGFLVEMDVIAGIAVE